MEKVLGGVDAPGQPKRHAQPTAEQDGRSGLAQSATSALNNNGRPKNDRTDRVNVSSSEGVSQVEKIQDLLRVRLFPPLRRCQPEWPSN